MSYPSSLSQPQPGQPGAVPPAPASPATLPVHARPGGWAALWVIALLVVLLLGLVAYVVTFLGWVASIIGAVLALLPLLGVLWVVRIVDRWEPEPPRLLWVALGWGAIASVVIALGVDLLLALAVGPSRDPLASAMASVVQAPIVEEIAKGLGILLILWIGRRYFDGPVDGVVYGAMIGAGFAFTENILYFADSLISGGFAQVTVTFVLRGILSPFAHVMFTAATGFAVGLAVRRGARGGAVFAPWAGGLAVAILLHALWNGSAAFADFFALYVTLQVPLFIAFVFGIVLLRREESRLTRARLQDYAAAGWFTPVEVDLLATGPGRRRALAWARSLPGDRTETMRAFIAEATRLASARQRALTGRDDEALADERAHLARATRLRRTLLL
ncbi:PrsW family intramembrane metalloprotease [Microbacterium thalli]|uniref:PrsW family intramembrane metalloprotease n=1 Tax=Microbacterium thalli TaxID=3027921 RepID=A0ABT5SG90_9MICO|nr:PrsW family intramembrane metalloprotease [Microbacterium thalli]MDD7929163.1 PrsW family intramembrane metalloprotease [Microbacterium thalli]MDD7961746.1 PrsW family intramembrane metalloprotease [Microbacterium thalli]MDN8549514.1 PrsW family intramembrane metalloprotease [Microbacterium thalli]